MLSPAGSLAQKKHAGNQSQSDKKEQSRQDLSPGAEVLASRKLPFGKIGNRVLGQQQPRRKHGSQAQEKDLRFHGATIPVASRMGKSANEAQEYLGRAASLGTTPLIAGDRTKDGMVGRTAPARSGQGCPSL